MNRGDGGFYRHERPRTKCGVSEQARTVSLTEDPQPTADRQRALDAAIAELVATNAGSVTMIAVAKRAGVDVQDIKEMWANTPELLTAALMSYAHQHLPVPDTGSLRGDLLGYAKSFAAAVNSPTGRRLLDALIATPKDWDVSGWRSAFFVARGQRSSAAMRRAVDRGELRADVDSVRVFDLLAAGLSTPVQFYDRPVTDEDCEFVVDLVLTGILVNR